MSESETPTPSEYQCQVIALREEADLCRNETAIDVAELLDDAANAIERLGSEMAAMTKERDALRDTINRASTAFFCDGADGETAAKMLTILFNKQP